jgi:electron transfer flavoprotein beta subunit
VIAVCWKWAPRRVVVGPLTGAVHVQPHSEGPSPADEAALEVALRLAGPAGEPVTVVCAGPPAADAALRDAAAAGAARLVRVDGLGDDAPSDRVAAALADVLDGSGVRLVVCGDRSLDRGSGAVPAFLAAALGAAQVLGVTAIDPEPGPAADPAPPAETVGGDRRLPSAGGVANREGEAGSGGGLVVTRRLDGGRRERVRVAPIAGQPAVISVEGAVARLRRASLPGVVAARTATVEVVAVSPSRAPAGVLGGSAVPVVVRTGPYRPPARRRPSPADADPHARILALTGAMTDRTPPVLVHLEPAAAAARILDQLRQWGYAVPAEGSGPVADA